MGPIKDDHLFFNGLQDIDQVGVAGDGQAKSCSLRAFRQHLGQGFECFAWRSGHPRRSFEAFSSYFQIFSALPSAFRMPPQPGCGGAVRKKRGTCRGGLKGESWALRLETVQVATDVLKSVRSAKCGLKDSEVKGALANSCLRPAWGSSQF